MKGGKIQLWPLIPPSFLLSVRAYPFDKLVEGMLQPEMILETVEIIKGAIEKDVLVNLIIIIGRWECTNDRPNNCRKTRP